MAKLSAVFIFLSLVSSISAQCSTQKANKYYQRSLYNFSVNLLKRLSESQENHFISSPFSAWGLIASLYFAAEGVTLSEMKHVLRLHGHKCFTEKYFKTYVNVFQSDAYETTLEKSSALFIDENIHIKQSFINKLTNIGIPDIVKKPFDYFDDVAVFINEYASNGTGGQVTDIITPEDIQTIYLIYVDALYFKAPWNVQFSTADTEKSAFYDDSGVNKIGDVNLMYVVDRVNVTYVRHIKSTVLELPYGDHNRVSMLFFLPDRDVTLSHVIDSMNRITLRSIFKLYRKHRAARTTVQIPRFKISSDLDNLKELLSDMGLSTMFDVEYAEFPGISDYSLYISNLIQKATIEVSEEGSERTTALFHSTTHEFVANKPFLFMIVDKHTEVPIFVGAYAKPSVF